MKNDLSRLAHTTWNCKYHITVRQALGKCFFAVSGVQGAEEIFDWGEILQRSRYSGSKIPGIVSKLHAIHQHLFVP